MLTVLIRYKKTRREVVVPARSVEFTPMSFGGDEPGLLINHGVEAEGGFHLPLTEGGDEDWRDVFVMNAQGQTVARYTL